VARPFTKNSKTLQILRLLNEHGALSIRALVQIVKPSCSRQSMYWILSELKKLGLICTRNYKVLGNVIVYYELRSEELSRQTVANMLSVSLDQIRLNHGSNRELFHSEEIALWTDKLRNLFPNGIVIPEGSFQNYPIVNDLLIRIDPDDDFFPDLILLPFGLNSALPSAIAVEVERTIKIARRIQDKLKKYVNGSHFLGVLYLCSRSGIEEAVRKVFNNLIKGKAPRIQKYPDQFLTFGALEQRDAETILKTSLSANENVSLKHWIHFLMNRENKEAVNKKFELPEDAKVNLIA
jgi:hypothetical protein